MLGGADTTPLNGVTRSRTPAAVTPSTAMTTAPVTRARSSATMAMKPAATSSTGGLDTSPRVTSVAGWATTMPAFLSAMMPRKSPMPAEIASLSDCGTALTTQSRAGDRLSSRNSVPDRKTAPSATCQWKPICPTTV